MQVIVNRVCSIARRAGSLVYVRKVTSLSSCIPAISRSSFHSNLSSSQRDKFIFISPLSFRNQSRSLFIQTQNTPNPSSLMFYPGKSVLDGVTGPSTVDYSSGRMAHSSPLARRLFRIDGVVGVFLGSDFITVSKVDDSSVTWQTVKPLVFDAIMEHYASGEPVYDSSSNPRSDTAPSEDDDEIVATIKELLDTRIRPAVQEDGGDIEYRSFDPNTGIVVLKMQGACSSCPSSADTLKNGIENMLMHYIPEVTSVVAEDGECADEHGSEVADASTEMLTRTIKRKNSSS